MTSRKFLFLSFFLFSFSVTSAQTKAGDISSSAKLIDADEFFPFKDGVARIKKGTSWALIDSSGNFVVPFNKWIFDESLGSHLIKVKTIKTYKTVIINTKGKVIVPENPNDESGSGAGGFSSVDEDGYACVFLKSGSYFINSNGDKIVANRLFMFGFKEHLSVMVIPHNTLKDPVNKFEFVDRKLNVIIPGPFDYAEKFSEGFACVGKKDEFGEMKYGFVNKKGTLVIPFIYSNKPQPFQDGLSLVEAKAGGDFKYAYINKKGDVAFKIQNTPEIIYRPGYSGLGWHDHYHYAEWTDFGGTKTFYIDTLGNIIPREKFYMTYNLPAASFLVFSSHCTNKILYQGQGPDGTAMGVLDLDTKRILPPIYHFMTQSSFNFDPESNRLLAETPYDNTGKKKKIVGYINSEGVYVIVKADDTKW